MKTIKVFVFFFCFFLFITPVYANQINSIKMDIYVDQNGTGHVTEVWDVNYDSLTEIYHPYYNLGEAKITNLSVSNLEKEFTTLNTWNIDTSFNEKAYKAGYNYISNGVELCFGLSKYGPNRYTVKYDIEGFIADLTDSQMAFWTLIPDKLDEPANNVAVKIHSDEAYRDDFDVWGYGYANGYAYVKDGYMEFIDDSFSTNEKIVILAKFPDNYFQTSNIVNQDFNYFLKKAEKGADEDNDFSFWDGILSFLPFVIIATSVVLGVKGSREKGTTKITRKINKKEINYFRDLPSNKDLFYNYFLAFNFQLMKKKTDLIGSFILKWLKEGKIKLEKRTSKFLKKETTVIVLDSSVIIDNLEEKTLYNHLIKASQDYVLESNEFANYCKSHYDDVLNWFDDALVTIKLQMVEQKKLISNQFGFKFDIDDNTYNEAVQLAGLKKFLNEFSNIKDRYPIEVTLWEEYLIYAQMFGIAEKVAKEFKQLYPNEISIPEVNNMIFIMNFSSSGMQSASSAYQAAKNYSAGGGGFSSFGGGGGSFGGGSGGGGGR